MFDWVGMIAITNDPSLYDALKAEGYVLPDETSHVAIDIPADGVMQLVLRINLTPETTAQVGRALQRMGQGNAGGKA